MPFHTEKLQQALVRGVQHIKSNEAVTQITDSANNRIQTLKAGVSSGMQAITDGAIETSKIIIPMGVGTILAKKAASQQLSTGAACLQVYQGGAYNALKPFPPLMLQQGVRIIGKSLNLAFVYPYVTEHYKGYEKVITTATLTGMDVLLTPLETLLTRLCTGEALPQNLSAWYAGASAQAVRHGFIWGSYLTIKNHVDFVFNQCGFQTNTHMGAFITSPVIGSTIASLMQPFYVVEVLQQKENAQAPLAHTNTRFGFFKAQTAVVRTTFEKEGAYAFFIGLPPQALVLSCLAYVANELMLLGEERKKAEALSNSSAPAP